MHTKKLFYDDPMARSCTAVVTGCTQAGDSWAITLDQTVFYPEGGGQACDLGTLGGTAVLDVQERDEQIIHLCAQPLEPGRVVEGIIDWPRRFDLMQQHTGEHILSGLIFDKYGYHNSGFHIGADGMEVDFDGPIPPEDLPGLELAANQAVWADLALHCWYPSPQELPDQRYRTKRALPWPVRLVQIPGIDSCACCGIHVARTGQVGIIKISSCTRLRGGVRLVLRCGQRALEHMNGIYEQARQVSQLLSAQMPQIAEATQKSLDALAAEKQRSAGLQRQIFRGIAAQYAGCVQAVHFEPGLEPGQVRQLTECIIAGVQGWCAVFSGTDGSFSYCLASAEPDLRQLSGALNQALQGRGGGKMPFWQGSLRCSQAEIEAFFQNLPPIA